jgi:hypothetical protein
MDIIMPKVSRAVWVLDFSSLCIGAGGVGGKSSLDGWSGAWLAACEGAALMD